MRYAFMIIFYLVLFTSCNESKKVENKRIYIYSTSNSKVLVNWYCYSEIGNFSSSKMEFVNLSDKSTLTLESFYLTDVLITNDTLTLQFWKNDTSDLELSKLHLFDKIVIDTNGNVYTNDIESRITRLLENNVDIFKPHKFNSKFK